MNNVDYARAGKRLVRYFWDPPPKNEDLSEKIWCLGKQYNPRPRNPDYPHRPSPSFSFSQGSDALAVTSADEIQNSHIIDPTTDAEYSTTVEGDDGWPAAFLEDFEAKIWLTYRSNFTPIPKSQNPRTVSSMTLSVRLRELGNQGGFISDTGWGCMIRSGQCLLANALLMLKLGRDWRRGRDSNEEHRLLSLFADDPNAPFSIHKFVEHGAVACGKHPGEWFGPSATARCIQALSNSYGQTGLNVYITGDGSDVYEDSFFKVAKSADGNFTPTLVLVGIRLGIDRVTPVYWEALKSSLQMPQSIGIAGGQPGASHYFIGTQGHNFFYLDPHKTQPCLPLYENPASYTAEQIDSCHTRRLRRIHVTEMDPSMLIAFLIQDEHDWKAWKQGVIGVQGKAVVHVADHESPLHGRREREGAVDEVETFDDTDDETVIA